MTGERSTHYRQFFANEMAKVAQVRRESLFFAGVFGLGLVAVLGGLASPWPVWVYVVAVIGLFFARGILGLRQSTTIAGESTTHLEIISTFIENDPGREEVRAKLRELTTPADNSNVPEALTGLLEGGSAPSETVRAVSHSAFGHALSKVRFAGFMRTALVLGGLFGTVLFFSFELTRPAFLQGSLQAIMPGLRGALASTLSGILGSVIIGWYGSRVDALLDGLILETQAFVGGPFIAATANRVTRAELHSETELWEALRQEVASMADRSSAAIRQLGDDVHAHAASLEAFNQRMEAIPQVRVPPELAKLEDVVERFHHSTEMLNNLIPPLLETVSSLGVFAPALMLEKIEGLVELSRVAHETARQGFSAMQETQVSLRQEVGRAADVVAAVPGTIEGQFASLKHRFQGLARENQVSQISGKIEDLATKEQAAEIGKAVTVLRDDLLDTKREMGEAVTSLDESAKRLSPVTADLEKASQLIADQMEGLGRAATEIVDARRVLAEAAGRLKDVVGWHQRANRAPLMKLLLMPLWPTGRLPFMSSKRRQAE